jgi:hypothetical protein
VDLESLNNSKKLKFEHWLFRIKNKLKFNADYFSTEALRMAYIEGWVKGEAARYIFPRTQEDYPKAYKLAAEIFKYLADVYKNLNKL